MRLTARRVTGTLTAAAVGATILVVPTAAWSTSSWLIGASLGAKPAQSQSSTAPPATSTLTAACLNSTSETAVITWTAVSHATSYQVVQSTTSGGTYTASPTQPSGAVTTVSITYTTATTLYYKLYAFVGTNWKGALSVNAKVGSTTPGFLVFATSGTRCTNN